jgi:hypothetical protein
MSAMFILVIWLRNSLTCTCVYLAVGRQSQHMRCCDPHETLTLMIPYTSHQFRRPLVGADIGLQLTLQQKEQRTGMWNVYMYFHPITR